MAGRAANGESSVFKGADGRWHGYVTVGLKPGHRQDRRHVTGKTRAVVVEKVRDLERNVRAGRSPPRAHPPSANGSNTGWRTLPPAACGNAPWRATDPPCGCI
jgi:integrase